MIIKINCEYNDNGAWCTNKNIKRSLFGVGARCCSEYNDKKCNLIKKKLYLKQNSMIETLLREAFTLGQQWVKDMEDNEFPINFNDWYNSVIIQEQVKNISNDTEERFISKTCIGENCSMCGKPATNKLGEEIPYDDPYPNRHNLTVYVCGDHFDMVFKKK